MKLHGKEQKTLHFLKLFHICWKIKGNGFRKQISRETSSFKDEKQWTSCMKNRSPVTSKPDFLRSQPYQKETKFWENVSEKRNVFIQPCMHNVTLSRNLQRWCLCFWIKKYCIILSKDYTHSETHIKVGVLSGLKFHGNEVTGGDFLIKFSLTTKFLWGSKMNFLRRLTWRLGKFLITLFLFLCTHE